MRKRGEKHNNRSFKKSFCDDNIITECTLNFFQYVECFMPKQFIRTHKKKPAHTNKQNKNKET